MRTVFRSFAFFLVLAAGSAHAQTFRAYLSINGNDTNPCSLGAPCRLLDRALAAVNDGGEIWMMDSGNFNTVTVSVTKSVSILAIPGALASILAINGPAISINSATARVSLRNLVIKSLAGYNSTSGVTITTADRVLVDRCSISDMPQDGILVSGAADVKIIDSVIRDNGSTGVTVSGPASLSSSRVTLSGNFFYGIYTAISAGVARVDVRDSILSDNERGAFFTASGTGTVNAAVSSSQVANNRAFGIFAFSASTATIKVSATGNLVVNNSTYGVAASGSNVSALLSDNTITGHTIGFAQAAGSTVLSTASNSVGLNGSATAGTITPLGKI